MTWYEADNYCGKLGGFLAEPINKGEGSFLRHKANKLPETNWWIGLRQFEKCHCISQDGSKTIISAFTKPDTLQWHTTNGLNGLGETTCPDEYQKYCSGFEWRWGLSGEKMEYKYWDTYDGQPNNVENDHCVTMGYKDVNQRWMNWSCDEKGENYRRMTFKPVCQKNT